MNTQQLDHTYIANTYARYPVTIVRGKGSLVWDENGKEYIDLATGIAVNSFGVSDPAWVRAVTEQLCTVQHTSNLYFTLRIIRSDSDAPLREESRPCPLRLSDMCSAFRCLRKHFP